MNPVEDSNLEYKTSRTHLMIYWNEENLLKSTDRWSDHVNLLDRRKARKKDHKKKKSKRWSNKLIRGENQIWSTEQKQIQAISNRLKKSELQMLQRREIWQPWSSCQRNKQPWREFAEDLLRSFPRNRRWWDQKTTNLKSPETVRHCNCRK